MHEQLFEAIESDRFSATMNVVSGFRQFVRAVSSSAEFQELMASLRSGVDLAAFLERFKEVVDRPTDAAHESPWDVAMATYLLALNRVDPKRSVSCAERTLTCSNGWWCREIAAGILSGNQGSPLEPAPGRPPVSSGV